MNLNQDIKMDTTGIRNAMVNFLVPILALLASVLLVLLVIVPGLSRGPELQTQLSETETLEATLRAKLTTLNRLLDFNNVLDEYVSLFGRALTDEPKVPELLTQIDQIARESGLAVTKLSYSIADAEALGEQALPYSVVVVNLGTLSTYDQITTFLSRLEEAARLVDVINYRFSSEISAGEGIYAGTFILRTPYRFVGGRAVTDVPVNIDITDAGFMRILDKVKALRFYDVTAATQFTNVEESDVEDVIEVPETQETTLTQ